MNSIDLIFNN